MRARYKLYTQSGDCIGYTIVVHEGIDPSDYAHCSNAVRQTGISVLNGRAVFDTFVDKDGNDIFEDFTTSARYAEYKIYSKTIGNETLMGYIVISVLGNPRDSDNCIKAVEYAGRNPLFCYAEFIRFNEQGRVV
jgi:hypothetical protein